MLEIRWNSFAVGVVKVSNSLPDDVVMHLASEPLNFAAKLDKYYYLILYCWKRK